MRFNKIGVLTGNELDFLSQFVTGPADTKKTKCKLYKKALLPRLNGSAD
jgi:hypothetical protein